ncbi:hypothetical protein HZA97_06735 [Candidatus Woesearchaeota archaeon]|nr:hypothetical protein [Candidatus Woesearchaeota archaeon]
MSKPNSATILIENNDGYLACYIYDYFKINSVQNIIDQVCKSPNLGYRFEKKLDHFFFFKDNYGYGPDQALDENTPLTQYIHSDLIGLEGGDLGEQKAKEKCLELLLKDKDILYKVVFLKENNPPGLNLITVQHAGWAD